MPSGQNHLAVLLVYCNVRLKECFALCYLAAVDTFFHFAYMDVHLAALVWGGPYFQVHLGLQILAVLLSISSPVKPTLRIWKDAFARTSTRLGLPAVFEGDKARFQHSITSTSRP
jgi:hypothetical protein